jgi:hypothetical protein
VFALRGWLEALRRQNGRKTKLKNNQAPSCFCSGVCEIKYHFQTHLTVTPCPSPRSVKVDDKIQKLCKCMDGTFFYSAPGVRNYHSNFDCSGGGAGRNHAVSFEMVLYFTNTGTQKRECICFLFCVSFAAALSPQCLKQDLPSALRANAPSAFRCITMAGPSERKHHVESP